MGTWKMAPEISNSLQKNPVKHQNYEEAQALKREKAVKNNAEELSVFYLLGVLQLYPLFDSLHQYGKN